MVFLREMSRSWCSTKGRCLHIVLLWMSSGAGGTRLERQELPVIMNGECLPAGRPPLCQNSVQHFRHEPTHNTDEGTPYLCQDLSVKELPGLECRCPTAPTTPARHAEDAPHTHTQLAFCTGTFFRPPLFTASVFDSTPFPTSGDIWPNEESACKAVLLCSSLSSSGHNHNNTSSYF